MARLLRMLLLFRGLLVAQNAGPAEQPHYRNTSPIVPAAERPFPRAKDALALIDRARGLSLVLSGAMVIATHECGVRATRGTGLARLDPGTYAGDRNPIISMYADLETLLGAAR